MLNTRSWRWVQQKLHLSAWHQILHGLHLLACHPTSNKAPMTTLWAYIVATRYRVDCFSNLARCKELLRNELLHARIPDTIQNTSRSKKTGETIEAVAKSWVLPNFPPGIRSYYLSVGILRVAWKLIFDVHATHLQWRTEIDEWFNASLKRKCLVYSV